MHMSASIIPPLPDPLASNLPPQYISISLSLFVFSLSLAGPLLDSLPPVGGFNSSSPTPLLLFPLSYNVSPSLSHTLSFVSVSQLPSPYTYPPTNTTTTITTTTTTTIVQVIPPSLLHLYPSSTLYLRLLRVTLYLLPLVGSGACPYRVCYYYLTLSIIPKRAGSPLRDCDSPRD
ncbi:hypothetical protein ANTQUA_LOCUS4125 [Anthophora quadrimaculata]